MCVHAWEQRKLYEFTKYETTNFTANQFTKRCFQGKYPVFDANSEIARINQYDQDEAYISIIKDGAGIGRVALRQAQSSIIGTMGYIKPINAHIFFVYTLMQNISWAKYQIGSTIPHLYYRDYGDEVVFIPNIHEQQKIGEHFLKIDNLITLHQRK